MSSRQQKLGRAFSTAHSASGQLETILQRTAEEIVEHGTESQAATLCAMAAAARALSCGAAAALVDWRGSEIARLRAFGIVHGVVERSLAPGERELLLERITCDNLDDSSGPRAEEAVAVAV